MKYLITAAADGSIVSNQLYSYAAGNLHEPFASFEAAGLDAEDHLLYEADVTPGFESAFERAADQDVSILSYTVLNDENAAPQFWVWAQMNIGVGDDQAIIHISAHQDPDAMILACGDVLAYPTFAAALAAAGTLAAGYDRPADETGYAVVSLVLDIDEVA